MMRWKFYHDPFSRDCSCDIEEDKKGSYVLYEDALSSQSQALAEQRERYEAVVKAARDLLAAWDSEGLTDDDYIIALRAALSSEEK